MSSRAGFTLVEVLWVAALLAILATVAVPAVGKAHARYQLLAAVDRLRADLRVAQQEARWTGQPVRVEGLTSGATGYAICRVADDGKCQVERPRELPAGVTVVAAEAVGGSGVQPATAVVYLRDGSVQATVRVRLANGAGARTVTVYAPTGFVEVKEVAP